MAKPRICAAIVSSDLNLTQQVTKEVDLFEVRIDLIDSGWQDVAQKLKKPWIATNRIPEEGGKAQESETKRINTLLEAASLGADVIDLELRTLGLLDIVPRVRKKAELILSHHDLNGTPSFRTLKDIVKRQIDAGADICKVVTTARSFEDNLAVLRLIKEFPGKRVVALTMGDLGTPSRILCPLMGGDFTYASLARGKESAPGQMTVTELRKIYALLNG